MLKCYVLNHDTLIPYRLKLPVNLGGKDKKAVKEWLEGEFGKSSNLEWMVTDKKLAKNSNAQPASVLPGIPTPATPPWVPTFGMGNPLLEKDPSKWDVRG